jgi:hypothetical protein
MWVSSQWLSGEKRIIYSPPRERPLTRGCGEQTNMATWVRESGGSLPGSRLNSKSVYTACQQCLEQHKARRGDKEHLSWPGCPAPPTTATATVQMQPSRVKCGRVKASHDLERERDPTVEVWCEASNWESDPTCPRLLLRSREPNR